VTAAVETGPSRAAAAEALRIAFVTDTYLPQVNGVAHTIGRGVEVLRERGHDVRVFTTSDPAAIEERGVLRYPSRPFWAYPQLRVALPAARLVARAFASWRPDIVHIATPFGVGMAGRAAARRLRIPSVSSYHTSLAAYARFYGFGAIAGLGWRYLRWFHNGTRRTFCPTNAITEELAARGFRNLSLWSRGVDTTQFHPRWRSDGLRASWGANPETKVVAYVGRLAAEKGLDVAIGAMRALSYERRDVVFVLAGSGPYELECRRRAPEGTVFTGQVVGRELSEVYASADVFVFPSTTDTFGNVVQEAMAAGLVVVAADTPQTREVLPDNAGIVVPPNDIASLASVLRALIDNPEALACRREIARTATVGRSWEIVFDRLEGEYRRVL
jgi:glycosyltransferase involved in cell wall biosynthesis